MLRSCHRRIWSLAVVLSLASTARADDDERRLAEIARLVEHRPRGAATEIEALLLGGHADAVTDAALIALGRLAEPETRTTLEAFTRHRRVTARMHAYEALAKLPGREIDSVLLHALRDPAAEVRALATRLLTARRARGAIDALLLALDRGVPEAALAVGHLAEDAEAARLTERLNKAPFDAMLAGCRALLCRRDLRSATKQQVLVALEETSGSAVHAFLSSLEVDPECALDPRTKASMAETLKRTKARRSAKAVTP